MNDVFAPFLLLNHARRMARGARANGAKWDALPPLECQAGTSCPIHAERHVEAPAWSLSRKRATSCKISKARAYMEMMNTAASTEQIPASMVTQPVALAGKLGRKKQSARLIACEFGQQREESL